MEPVVWSATPYPNFCKLKILNNVEKEWMINMGLPVVARFPKDAYFEMDERYPKDLRLADTLMNTEHMVVVSQRLRDFLSAQPLGEVEFLQVAIHNHKKRVEDPNYFIVHPLRIVDCIDKDKSEIRWNQIDPDRMSAVSTMVLKPGSIPHDVLLFRPQHLWKEVMVDAKLAADIEAKFTGTSFVTVEEYGG